MYWIGIVLFILFAISVMSGQSSSPSQSVGGKDCTKCKEDFAWYNSLNKRKKALNSAWWVLRKVACAANGC